MRQDHFAYDDVDILDVVMMGHAELWAAMQEKDTMLRRAADDPEAFEVERYGELEDIVLAHDGYGAEQRAADILDGLHIRRELHREPLSVLSGGYKLRVLLAQTLAASPDILLLDEPTNHLDIVSIGWLEQFLAHFPGCVLIISHDHHFLDATCSHIVDIDYERLTLYRGNYSQFERAKIEERERRESEIAKQQATIAQHEAFVQRFRAKATKARQAQSRLKQIERIDIEELPVSSRRYPNFRFHAARDTGKEVLHIKALSKAFGDNVVLRDVDLTLLRGQRLAVIGPNGIGKSTLLKIATGELEADAGLIEWGHATDVGYFSQDQAELKRQASTSILDWLWAICPDQPVGFVRGKLAEVLFGKDDVDKKVGALSGGELARLAFARLIVTQPTVLVLDEPTNHLDLEGIDALARGLEAYPNAVIFVSHDRWFVSRLATRVLDIRPDGVHDIQGSYDDYLLWADEAEDRLER